MGIKLSDIDETNVMQAIARYRGYNILSWIHPRLLTEEVCRAAVEANGLSLKDVPGRLVSKDLLKTAVIQDYRSFSFAARRLIDDEVVDLVFDVYIQRFKPLPYLEKVKKGEG